MRSLMSPRNWVLGVCLMAALTFSQAASALTFTIDSSQSSITAGTTLSSSLGSLPLTPQSAGSETTSFSGTIDADVTPTDITFNSAIADAIVSGVYSPAPGGGTAPGVPGTPADGDYAFLGLSGGILAAIRDLNLSFSSGAIALAGGSFDATSVSVSPTAGSFDLNAAPIPSITPGSASSSAFGGTSVNGASGGTLVLSGSTLTLTLPIDIVTNPDSSTAVDLNGVIVATAIIPEPASVALMGLGGTLLMFRRRHA